MKDVAFLVLVYTESWDSYKKSPDSRSWDFKTVATYDNNITAQKTRCIWNRLISYDKGHPQLTQFI